MVSAAALLLPLTSPALAGPAAAAPSATGTTHRNVRVCAAPTSGTAACDAILHEVVSLDGGVAPSASSPSGYGPADLRSAYNLPSTTAGGGQTIGIVDAYNDPNVASDVGVYRSHFGLPACTVASGCFRVVDQTGGTRLPKSNGGWAQETSLDVDMVSAICPNCHILLVEAGSSSLTNLGTAVNTAARLGATEITNSYGGSESTADPSYDSAYYDHPGIAVTASSGDGGYGVEYPAASGFVTAVGGTTLTRSAAARGWTETAWSSAGSGCSAYDQQPAWQSSVANITSVCRQRAVADVSADADPNAGVAVYDSFTYHGQAGWLVFGGTSVASPITAGVYALAGNAAATSAGSYPYGHTSSLNDVTSGSNGSCGTVLCNAGTGWDGPTGLGSPNGTGGF
jgi:subtilase family serine protease